MNKDIKGILRDFRTHEMVMLNENYKVRLLEGYQVFKSLGINTLEEFTEARGTNIGAFSYYELTYFDRIQDKEYLDLLTTEVRDRAHWVEAAKNNPNYGDSLASWGTVGKTPKRQEMIDNGILVEGLTEEENQSKWRM